MPAAAARWQLCTRIPPPSGRRNNKPNYGAKRGERESVRKPPLTATFKPLFSTTPRLGTAAGPTPPEDADTKVCIRGGAEIRSAPPTRRLSAAAERRCWCRCRSGRHGRPVSVSPRPRRSTMVPVLLSGGKFIAL
ncbi:unnamed protein product [Merluccius merluccius]